MPPKKQITGIIEPGIIRTYTGVAFDVFNPTPEDVLIEDIAHALSHLCRFGGHTARFYSVAEHCLKCTEIVPREHQLAALLHDASEAYIVDLPTPLKRILPQYCSIEYGIMELIAEKFGFRYPLHSCIKEADETWLQYEWKNLMLENNLATLAPADAETLFLEKFNELT